MTLPGLSAERTLYRQHGHYIGKATTAVAGGILPQYISCAPGWLVWTSEENSLSCANAEEIVEGCSPAIKKAAEGKLEDGNQVKIEYGPHTSVSDANLHITFYYTDKTHRQRCHVPVKCSEEPVYVTRGSKTYLEFKTTCKEDGDYSCYNV